MGKLEDMCYVGFIMRPTSIFSLFLLPLFVATGCGDDDMMGVCTPGETQVCVCPGNTSGAQACNSDGNGWGVCACGVDTPDGGVSDAVVADVIIPDAVVVDAIIPDAIIPDAIIPDAIDGSVPDAIIPDATIPDASIPDAVVTPDMNVPDMNVPDMNVPDMNVPDMTVPDMTAPDMNVPDMDIFMCGNLAGTYTINVAANQNAICGQLVPNGSVVTAMQVGNDVDVDFAGGMQSCTLTATCACNTTTVLSGFNVMIVWDTTMGRLVASGAGITCNFITTQN